MRRKLQYFFTKVVVTVALFKGSVLVRTKFFYSVECTWHVLWGTPG